MNGIRPGAKWWHERSRTVFDEVIASAQNPRVKEWASLLDRRGRVAQRRYVVEGVRNVEAHVQAGAAIDVLLVSELATDSTLACARRIAAEGIRCCQLSALAFAKVSQTEHSQGLVAVAPFAQRDLDVFLAERPASAPAGSCADVVLVADRIGDPGNLGTMLRTAQAVGVACAIVTAGSADPYAPKVVRAAMGAHASIPVFQAEAQDVLRALVGHGYRVLPSAAGAVADAGAPADLSGRIALVIGNETQGLSEPFAALGTVVSLVMPGGGESLNAAIAGAVLLYEALRWRGVGVAMNFVRDV